jgi:WhiB family redox-sensing transcriptional regulator
MFAYRLASSEPEELEALEALEAFADLEAPEMGQQAAAWEDAACRDGSGSLTAIFFSEEPEDIELAKAICSTCPLIGPCLEGALERREPAGVWGGQLFVEGEVVARKRKRGRPPKVAPALPATEPESVRRVLRGVVAGEDSERQLKSA